MRILTPFQSLGAAAVVSMLVACSSGTTIAPKPAFPQGDAHSLVGYVPSGINSFGPLNFGNGTGQRIKSFYACPATGSIKYISDANIQVISIYAGKFKGQAPCGQITSDLDVPAGLYVKAATHDLYVANLQGHNVLVFHRGQTTPYNTYTDPSVQDVEDVTVARDGTVIASNNTQVVGSELGSISTWIPGPNGGTFVGNFPMTNDEYGLFITVKKNGTVYYNDNDIDTKSGVLWSLSCPAGACGPQTQVTGVSFRFPGGMTFDGTRDLVVNDNLNLTVDTFELPNPTPSALRVEIQPLGLAINDLEHHMFVTDGGNRYAAEYLYPSGKLVGTVPGISGGAMVGIAVDP